jgi:hypothetical protein
VEWIKKDWNEKTIEIIKQIDTKGMPTESLIKIFDYVDLVSKTKLKDSDSI